MAPDYTQCRGDRAAQINETAGHGWPLIWPMAGAIVTPRSFDFDGKTFRKPGGLRAAKWFGTSSTNQMTLELFIGGAPCPAYPAAPGGRFSRQFRLQSGVRSGCRRQRNGPVDRFERRTRRGLSEGRRAKTQARA